MLIDDLIGDLLKSREHMPDGEAKLVHRCLQSAKKHGGQKRTANKQFHEH